MTNRRLITLFAETVACTVLLGITSSQTWAQETLAAFELPSTPAGIAVDGEHVWILDADAKRVHHVGTMTGKVDRSLDVDVSEPRGLAFDGRRLWIADRHAGVILAVDAEEGAILKRIELGEGALASCESIEDIAWDGEDLWVACYAGFCSTYNQCDPETGRIKRSVYANCNPRGIASDGETLWSICYNGDRFPSKIDARALVPDDRQMQMSRRFLMDIEGRTPVGLAHDAGRLWYANGKTSTAYQIVPGELDEEEGQLRDSEE